MSCKGSPPPEPTPGPPLAEWPPACPECMDPLDPPPAAPGNAPAPPTPPGAGTSPPPASKDPIAQSFMFQEDRFISSIDIFFASVDPVEKDFWVSIREMKNGFPVDRDIHVESYSTDDVTVSDTAQIPFNAKFDPPVFVEGGKEYCFVVGGWTPGTRIWLARVGDPLIDDPDVQVETQPSTGSSFKSQNGYTWNAEQYEDVKYTMYVAKFLDTKMNVVLNDKITRWSLPEDPLECQINSNAIRVRFDAHGMARGDKFRLFMFDSQEILLKTDRAPTPGQVIYTTSGRGTISKVTRESNGFRVSFMFTVGSFVNGERFTTATTDLIGSNLVAETNAIEGEVDECSITHLAGIPLTHLTSEHIVDFVDTPNTFIFKLPNTVMATSSGRFGGRGSSISSSVRFDVFNVSSGYMLYGSSEEWVMSAVGTHSDWDAFIESNYQVLEDKMFTPGSDTFMDQPAKLCNRENLTKISRGRGVEVRASFVAPNEYISPVINLSTTSGLFISNNVGWVDEERAAVEPNAELAFTPENQYDSSNPYKYVTRAVTLSNPASDLIVSFDVYKDKDADFEVYFKLIYSDESVGIDEKEWILMPVNVKRDSTDLNDRIEYELLASDIFGSQWEQREFNTFKIKLVGRSKNTCRPPTFKSFRAIALT